MKKLYQIVLWIQVVGGAVVFAAIFSSTLPISVKLIIAIGLIFISTTIFLLLIGLLLFNESFLGLMEAIFPVMNELEQNKTALMPSGMLREYLAKRTDNGIRLRSTNRLGYLLIGLFVFWVAAGWALSRYIV